MYRELVKRTLRYMQNNGLKATVRKVIHYRGRSLKYSEYRKRVILDAKELERQRQETFEKSPLLSVVIPLYQTKESDLRAIVHSLQAQTYGKFEICFSEGSPLKDRPRIRKVIDELASGDNRIRYIDDAQESLGISENTNQALSIASGEYIVLGDHDDLYEPNAFYECVKLINEATDSVDVIYTDEDKVDEAGKNYMAPFYKSDFDIDYLRSVNYICHMFVFSRRIYDKIGGFRSEYNGAQDYDFILRAVEQADYVYHIPKVLYHWRMSAVSTAADPKAKLYAFEAGRKAIAAHYERLGINASVEMAENLGSYRTRYWVQGEPLISIVIPNKDHVDDLKKCIDSINEKSTYRNYEYVIVENNSELDETFAYYEEISKHENVSVITWDDIFNYSEINNFGVAHAKGEYILLLNNDISMIAPEGLEDMLGICQRSEVGIVGARLYYDDDTLQHAGTVVGIQGIAGHAFQRQCEDDGSVYFNKSMVSSEYTAVTAACLMTKKSVWNEVGGLEPGFQVAFNDVDYCMKVRQAGYLVVYDANATYYHYESKSRGLEDTPEKVARFHREIALFQERWGDFLEKGDPYYNPNLTLLTQDFTLRKTSEIFTVGV